MCPCITRSGGGGYSRRCALMTAWCFLAKTVRSMTFPTRSWITLLWTTGMVSSTAMFPRYASAHTFQCFVNVKFTSLNSDLCSLPRRLR